jgi:ribosomal protein S30
MGGYFDIGHLADFFEGREEQATARTRAKAKAGPPPAAKNDNFFRVRVVESAERLAGTFAVGVGV